MKLIFRPIFSLFSNLLALILAAKLVTGFYVPQDIKSLIIIAAIFTLINMLIKPVLKLILAPFIILSFGLASILINAGLLYLLDFLRLDVTITGTQPLLYATLLIGITNLAVGLSAKLIYR